MVLAHFTLALFIIPLMKIYPDVSDKKPKHKPIEYISSHVLKLILLNVLSERYD